MKKPKKQEEKYIAISNIALNLGLLEQDVENWLSGLNPSIKSDNLKRKCVPATYLETLSKDVLYEYAKRKSLESENTLRINEFRLGKEILTTKRKELLNNYSKYIIDLEQLHRSCLERIHLHNHESALTAAYLLFSKVISCLKLGTSSIDNGYWCISSVLREIDEALDIALYFIISNNTEKGREDLRKWFRLNRTPSHSICRKEISKYFSQLTGENENSHLQIMNELYESKSKFTHPTYSSIREVTQFDTSSGIKIRNIEYGTITFETKLLELAHFFCSSIWSSFQYFHICFSRNLPLTEEEDGFLINYNKIFQYPNFHNW